MNDIQYELTKEQYEAADALNDARIEKSGFSPFVVVRSTVRTGETFKFADGRTGYKTAERYTMTLDGEHVETAKSALARHAAGEEIGRHIHYARMNEIVPLFPRTDELVSETAQESTTDDPLEHLENVVVAVHGGKDATSALRSLYDASERYAGRFLDGQLEFKLQTAIIDFRALYYDATVTYDEAPLVYDTKLDNLEKLLREGARLIAEREAREAQDAANDTFVEYD